MFKRLLVVAALVIALAVPMNAAAIGNETGVVASYKNVITIDYIVIDENTTLHFVFFGDFDRALQRAINNGNMRPQGIEGYKRANGNYQIMVSMSFVRMPLGELTWEEVTDIIPNMKSVGDLRPVMFETFAGYEDVFATASFDAADTQGLIDIIRALYTVEFESYNNALFGR